MRKYLQYHLFLFFILLSFAANAQFNNNCSNAITVCNNQLAEQLDDGVGTQECPSGGCGCMLAGEKNTRWFKIVIQTGGILEFTIQPYNGNADYDFSVWNQGVGGTCPSGARLGTPDRCNYAAPQSPTGIRGTGNGNSNSATGNLFSNNMTVTAGQVIYILVDNWDGTNVGFRLDFFGGAAGSGTGTTATFSCSGVNICTTCNDADCKTYHFDTPTDYSFDETAANGACHSNFGYASTKTATVCGTFTVPAPYTTVEFPLNRGYEVTTTNGANTTTCLNSAVITYTVWDNCAAAPLVPNPAGSGIYTGLNNVSTYKVCKTITVTGADCWLSRICLPYWTMIPNDIPCSATPLTVNAPATSGSNAGATSGFDAGCTGYKDVWYSFVAPASGRVQVNVIPDASSDVKISLVGPQAGLTGGVNDCNKPCDQMTNVAEGCNNYAGTGGAERLFAFVIPGQTYFVWISGTAARPTANFTVQVTETITNTSEPRPGPDIVGAPDAIPANDDCSNAIDLNPMCSPRAGTNVGATAICTDPDPQYVAAITLENNVWYKWTAPANNGNAQVTLEVTGASCTDGAGVGATGIQFGIFRGTCASLTPVSSGTTTLTFTPIPGATYYFVIDGNAGAQCTFNINIKRPTVTSQSCATGNYCTGSALNASFNYSYTGSNPGYRWAYCKSTWGSTCTIDLDNPATYSVYNPAAGLPNPGCTPATYTFVGYILADNGATTIAPGYPRPQPASANCVRSTNPCTFNIYPDIRNTVTVTSTSCSQVVTSNAACSPAAPITITGNINQTAGVGTSGTFTPVTITWNAPYAATAPAACSTYTIQNTYACPGPSGSDACPGQTLTLGAAPVASNNIVAATTNEYVYQCGNGNNGSGVWFNFVAPNSGNVNINLTSVGSGNDLNAMLYLFDSRQSDYVDCYSDGYFYSDGCASCTDLENRCELDDQLSYCSNLNGTNGLESIQARYLNPGETYYVMVDGYYGGNYSTGNFSIQAVDAGGGPARPSNDVCTGAIDISTNCSPFPANNIGATSLCSSDLLLTGASTENSVWYTYTATYTGAHTILYRYANGYHCVIGTDPGVQFGIYTSSTNNCNGTFTALPGGEVSTGTTNGSITLNLTAGQKYYIFIDGFAGNECTFEFQVYNRDLCCAANLGATEGTDRILCFGDAATFGESADPINFGSNAQGNPVIGWQLSSTQPTVNNPFNPANSGKPYLVGQIDWTSPSGTTTTVQRDWQGNYNEHANLGYFDTPLFEPVTISGFPAGSTFNTATDTITVCIYFYMQNTDNLDLQLIAPDGTAYQLMANQCGTTNLIYDVCFSNKGTATNVTSSCSGTNYAEVTGLYLPSGNWAGLNGEGINGNWSLRINDSYADGNGIWFYGFNVEIKKPVTVPTPPVVGPTHGDINIVNNDPFKYGSQTFWLTPVTFINYNAATGALTSDSCYHYGTPVKVTLLERMTTPNITPVCAAPGDGSNGVALTVTSPTGGMPGLPGTPTSSTLNFSNTTALAIPDNNATWNNRDITVTGFDASATLTANTNITVCLTFNPQHTFASDLDIQLIAPNGGVLVLTPGSGTNGGNLSGQYCFNISGTQLLEAAGGATIPTGTYDWSGNYNNIAGTLLNGLWRLQVRDNGSGDIGTLASWSLSLNGLVPTSSPYSYTVTGTGAASGISYPSPPVGENETSNSFNVSDGQAWSVLFTDANGCASNIGGSYNKPTLGNIQMDTTVCDGLAVSFTTSNPTPQLSQYRVILDFDSYPQDVSWFIYDAFGNVVATGGGYSTTTGANTTTTPATINPENGPFRFVLYDGFDDGFGSGGGTANNGGSTTLNFIRVVEVFSDGTVDTLFSQNYAYCTPVYCVGPNASLFSNLDINLGTPTGTFTTGITAALETGGVCGGSTIAGAVTLNPDGSGTVNTTAAGVNPGTVYSLQYNYTDQYGCSATRCRPLTVFPTVSISPTISCAVNPPTITVNGSCAGCNATYIAEYSYNNGASWTTATTANFQEIFTFARVRNTVTGEVACEVTSAKLADCPTVLPIELIYIRAVPVDNEYIKVSWATASELNTKVFEVLRSTDAISFTKIGEVAAAGNSNSLRDYAYDDRNVVPGVIYYYQVREIDRDNHTQLTNIVNAHLDKQSFDLISIYPNPTVDNTVITMYSEETSEVSLVVYNDIGELMHKEQKTLKEGLNEWTIATEKWAKAVYYFILTNKDKPVTRQVIKLR